SSPDGGSGGGRTQAGRTSAGLGSGIVDIAGLLLSYVGSPRPRLFAQRGGAFILTSLPHHERTLDHRNAVVFATPPDGCIRPGAPGRRRRRARSRRSRWRARTGPSPGTA